jgi:hypothetical protein
MQGRSANGCWMNNNKWRWKGRQTVSGRRG